MSIKSSQLGIIAVVICGLIFAVSLGLYISNITDPNNQVVTPNPSDTGSNIIEPQGVLSLISGSDLEKLDVRRGVAVYKDTVYFVHQKTEAEIKADLAKQNATLSSSSSSSGTTTPANPDESNQPKIDPNAYTSSQLMSWSKDKGVNIVSELTNVDGHSINRLSSVIDGDNLHLSPCMPSSDTSVVCETTKIYQFNITTSKLALINDVSTEADKASKSKELVKKYKFDDLGQPYWQDVRGGVIYGIKNVYTPLESGKGTALYGYLMSTPDGLTEKPLVAGAQLAKADLKVNSKGFIVVDQSGTIKNTDTCIIEHRIMEINPDNPSEQKKAVVKTLSLDEKGEWNDGRIRNDQDQKNWVSICKAIPEYSSKTPSDLLQINLAAKIQLESFN